MGVVVPQQLTYCVRSGTRRRCVWSEATCVVAVISTRSPTSSEVWSCSTVHGLHRFLIQTSLAWTVSGRRNHWACHCLQVQLCTPLVLHFEGYRYSFFSLSMCSSFLLLVLTVVFLLNSSPHFFLKLSVSYVDNTLLLQSFLWRESGIITKSVSLLGATRVMAIFMVSRMDLEFDFAATGRRFG